MKPERMVIQLTDGSEFPCMVSVSDTGVLTVKTSFGMTFQFRADSVWSVALRLMELINEAEAKAKAELKR